MTLEKQKAIHATVRNLIYDAKDITDLKEINACICKFYEKLFKNNVSKSDLERESLLNGIVLPNLNSKSFDICESKIIEKYLITVLKIMPNDKFLGHDDLTKKNV